MEFEDLKAMAERNKKYISAIGQQNGQIKRMQGLINNSKANPQKLFVIEGIWAHQRAVESDIRFESIFICPSFIHTQETLKMIETVIPLAEQIFSVSEKVFAHLSEKEGNFDGLISICYPKKFELSDIRLGEDNILIVLDGVEIPGNVGTILRTADGAGADGVILCNRKVRLSHPKLIRSSQCAIFDVPTFEMESEELIPWLQKQGFKIFLLDTRAEKLYSQADYRGRVAFVAGSERYGISKVWYETKHHKIKIPMLGKADSLNVAIASTIILYEASTQQRQGGVK